MLHEISEITPNLFLSSAIAVTERQLKKLNITLVINVTKELPVCPLGEDVKVIKISIKDRPTENLHQHFDVSMIHFRNYFFLPNFESG